MTRARQALFSCALVSCALAATAPSQAARRPAPQQVPHLVLMDDETELEKALAARTVPADLPVRVAAFSLPVDDQAVVRLLIVAGIDDPREGIALASVAYALFTGKGERAAHALRRGEFHRSSPGTFAFAGIVEVPPGAYRLRFATMRDGRVGGSEAAVVARVQSASSVRLGDLIVGEVAGGDPAIVAMAGRRIRGDRLVATLPVLLAAGAPSGLAMTLEVATGAGGSALLTAPLAMVTGEGSPRVAQAVADARLLPPGDYVATVSVALPGADAARVTAPFTIDRAASAAASDARAVPRGAVPAAAGFRLEDVLDAAVVGPFLDELIPRAPARARPAIEQARAGRFADAAQAAASKTPDDPAGPFLEGLSLLSRKQLQPASQAFRDALKAAPDYFVAAFYIGACYAAGGRDQQAVNAWQTSLVGLEQYPVVFRLLGEALMRTGQPDRAVQALEEASSKWPDDPDLRLRLLRAALEARQYDRVTAGADRALTRPPGDPEVLFLGMQAVYERVTRGPGAPADDLARFKRYRDAYAAAGGPRQSLVDEWLAAIEKKVSAPR